MWISHYRHVNNWNVYLRLTSVTMHSGFPLGLENLQKWEGIFPVTKFKDWKSPGKSHKIQEKSGNLFVIFSDIYNELCIIYYNGSSFQLKNHNILKLLKKSGNFCQITFRPEKEMSPSWQTARLSTHVALNVLGYIQVREFCGTVCELGIYRSDCNLALFLRFRRTLPFGSLPLEKDPVSLFNTQPKSGIVISHRKRPVVEHLHRVRVWGSYRAKA